MWVRHPPEGRGAGSAEWVHPSILFLVQSETKRFFNPNSPPRNVSPRPPYPLGRPLGGWGIPLPLVRKIPSPTLPSADLNPRQHLNPRLPPLVCPQLSSSHFCVGPPFQTGFCVFSAWPPGCVAAVPVQRPGDLGVGTVGVGPLDSFFFGK